MHTLNFQIAMNKLITLGFVFLICVISSCEDHDKNQTDFYILNTELTSGHLAKGFSYKEMNIISPTNPKLSDFTLSVHTNETGIILGPMLLHSDLENRFLFRKSYNDSITAQNYFDTLSILNGPNYQTFAFDIKPFDVWQIKTNTGETGIILILETRAESINNTLFAEIKFKAKRLNT